MVVGLAVQGEGEPCGGAWDTRGSCAQELVCQPLSTRPPVLGAGGFFPDTWDPPGICVDPLKYQQEHSPCYQLLGEYYKYRDQRKRRNADVMAAMTSSQGDVIRGTLMTALQGGGGTGKEGEGTTKLACVRKPDCTPEGYFAPLQCDGCVGQCWCSTMQGQEIPASRGHPYTVTCW